MSMAEQNSHISIIPKLMSHYDNFLECGYPLSALKSECPQCVFPEAGQQLPQFLKENLLDDDRVIKYFQNDVQACLRVFYYQYLKLCFQMETDFQIYLQKLEDLLVDEEFELVFEGERPSLYSNLQFKRFIVEFMEILDDDEMTVERALSEYPIMDQVFVHLLRSLLIHHNRCSSFDDYIPKEEMFEFLADYFRVDVAMYEDCLKFIDSDVFVYEQTPERVYMVYIEYPGQVEQMAQTIRPSDGNISSVKQMVSQVNIEEMKEALEVSHSAASHINDATPSDTYEFVDYTHARLSQQVRPPQQNTSSSKDPKEQSSEASQQTPLFKENTSSSKDNSSSFKYDNFNTFADFPEESTKHIDTQILKTKPINLRGIDRFIDKVTDSFVPYQDNQTSRLEFSMKKTSESAFASTGPGTSLQDTKQNCLRRIDSIYGKKTGESIFSSHIDYYQQRYGSNTATKNSFCTNLNGQKIIVKDPLANLSRQFTDSIILKTISQPYQSAIAMIKSRARAQRTAIQSSFMRIY